MTDRVPSMGLEAQGIATKAEIFWNLTTAPLVEHAVRRGEGLLAKDGPLVVRTGKHTGRSAQDKFTVKDTLTEDVIWWNKGNKPMDAEAFDRLHADFMLALADKDQLYVADLYGGSQPEYRVRVRVINELAWHNLFIRTLLVRPEAAELADFAPEFTIIDLPSFRADPERHGSRSETVVAVNLSKKLILIGGTSYAGEMKKSVFGLLNFLLPPKGIMPMHCSANIGPDGDSAIFFGLSGTGKTTLSADPNRTLIGDDEHGWSDTAVFNFEGGCYAKMIRLSPEAEPEIYATTKRFGTVLENVVIDPETRELDLDDATFAENSRGAYPIDFIPNSSEANMGPLPRNIVMLTADAFGVLAADREADARAGDVSLPVRLHRQGRGNRNRRDRARGDFFDLLRRAVHAASSVGLRQPAQGPDRQGRVDCWLVNTGWTGGKYGVGKRMPIKATRALLNAALDGSLKKGEFRKDSNFGFEVPTAVPGCTDCSTRARPGPTRRNMTATAAKLVDLFVENFAQFADQVDEGVRQAAPKAERQAPAQAQSQTTPA